MDLFGIGLPEIIFILLLVVIIFGPNDLEKMAKTIGGGLFRFFNSETFRNLRRIGELPAEFARKAGLDEFRATVNSTKIMNPENSSADQTVPTASTNPEKTESENRIEPPAPSGNKPA
jgi:Sec-independent protein translocase protein TatA